MVNQANAFSNPNSQTRRVPKRLDVTFQTPVAEFQRRLAIPNARKNGQVPNRSLELLHHNGLDELTRGIKHTYLPNCLVLRVQGNTR